MRYIKQKNRLFFFVLGGVIILITFCYLFNHFSAVYEDLPGPFLYAPPYSGPVVQIGSTTIPVDLATTTADIRRGLSGRPKLDHNLGLLFIFSRPAIYQFWMPDMHFPIDIIWIEGGRVVDVDENVSPKFDPAKPVFYRPSKPITRVLEVNAGWFTAQGLKIGDSVIFKNIK